MLDASETVRAICQDVQSNQVGPKVRGSEGHLDLQKQLAQGGSKVLLPIAMVEGESDIWMTFDICSVICISKNV